MDQNVSRLGCPTDLMSPMAAAAGFSNSVLLGFPLLWGFFQ